MKKGVCLQNAVCCYHNYLFILFTEQQKVCRKRGKGQKNDFLLMQAMCEHKNLYLCTHLHNMLSDSV